MSRPMKIIKKMGINKRKALIKKSIQHQHINSYIDRNHHQDMITFDFKEKAIALSEITNNIKAVQPIKEMYLNIITIVCFQ